MDFPPTVKIKSFSNCFNYLWTYLAFENIIKNWVTHGIKLLLLWRLSDLTSSNLGFSMNKFFQLCNLIYRQTQVIRKFFSGLNLSRTVSLILILPFGATNCKTFGGLLPLLPTSVLPFPVLIPWSLRFFFFFLNHHPCCPWGCCTQK